MIHLVTRFMCNRWPVRPYLGLAGERSPTCGDGAPNVVACITALALDCHVKTIPAHWTMAVDLNLDEIYQFALKLGKDAGKLLQQAAQKRMSGDAQLDEEEKLNSVDIVTKTDEGRHRFSHCVRLHLALSNLNSELLFPKLTSCVLFRG